MVYKSITISNFNQIYKKVRKKKSQTLERRLEEEIRMVEMVLMGTSEN